MKMSSLCLSAVGVLLTLCAMTSHSAETLTIERLYASPDLAGAAPKSLKFSSDGQRVTYLKGKDSDRLQQDLWEYHIGDRENRLLVDSRVLQPEEETLSDVEKARRERMRIAGRGIIEYVWAPNGQSILFPLGGDLYLYRLANQEVTRLTQSPAFETDPQISPQGGFVSFVRDYNLWVIDLESGVERQITRSGDGSRRNGMAEFIAMEEMDRDTGYWWSPDDRYLAFARVDESPVEVAQRYQIFAEDFKVTTERYPFAGKANARVELAVADLKDQRTVEVNLGSEKDIYLARVNWFPDSKRLLVQRQTRSQQQLDLLTADAASGATKLLLRENSTHWINLHHNLKFVGDDGGFLWTSERSGFQHIFAYDAQGKLRDQLTVGDWVVKDIHAVDPARDRVLFSGFADSPLELHLYEAPLSGAGAPRRLTDRSGWHDVVVADDGSAFIDNFSSPDRPPQVSLHNAAGERLTWLVENPLDDSHPYAPFLSRHSTPEFGTLTAADGQTLHYSLLKPHNFDPEQRYPAIVHVYGGPHVQVVSRQWGRGITFHQFLQQQGYVVFSIDNRGSAHRGTAFEFPIHKQMSLVEVADQKIGTEYLKSLPYIDGGRVGIYGWSYGGYMTLMALMQAPETWAAGISGAPVTDWALYDTHYTERYMGKPADNAEGYRLANVLTYTQQLTDPLLLIHGMADDNVLLNHSTVLLRQLQEQGKLFDSMLYPNETHRFAEPAVNVHRTHLMMAFFARHLGSAR